MNPTFTKVYSEIQRGMRLAKCRKCGCMRGTLENLKASLPMLKIKDSKELLKNVNKWLDQLEPLEYPCFGCKYCIPPEAMTILTKKYPSLAPSTLSSCEINVTTNSWPPVEGEYTIINKSAPIAVSILASTRIEDKLAKLKPEGLCIIGKTETENIGIDKIVKNIISNPAISRMIIAGKDPEGHQSGQTLISLWQNGVDKNMRVIGSEGRRPILKNVSRDEINKFRDQIELEDMRGCVNSRSLAKRIRELHSEAASAECAPDCGCNEQQTPIKQPVTLKVQTPVMSGCGCSDEECGDQYSANMLEVQPDVQKVTAKRHGKNVKLDKAGYFVILPSKRDKNILVEHYSYDNKLLRKIVGKTSRDIYFKIINNGWVTELSHAAYLGKELAKAELSIKKGFKFVQDGA